MAKIKVGVIGASGYSGEELIRLLLGHPEVELACVTSRQHAGRSLAGVMPQFAGRADAERIVFAESSADAVAASGAVCAILALPHGLAPEFALPLIERGLKVIDLSADFRLRDPAVYREYYGAAHPSPQLLAEAVYGMPELHRDQIRQARLIASPGCYPTSIILPLAPLLKRHLVDPARIVANSLSGVSGAGRKAEVDYLYTECNESARAYGIPRHRHLPEIEQELSLAAGEPVRIVFIPHLIPLTRGILTTITVPLAGSPAAVQAAYDDDFGPEPFIRLLPDGALPEIKHVARTNFLDLAWRHDARTGSLIILSAEDNLTKGAAGQAVQSMNIVYGWPETAGL